MLNHPWQVKLIKILTYLATILLVLLVFWMVSFIIIQGISYLNMTLLKESSSLIITTLMVVFLALLIALPLGIFSAIYLQVYTNNGKLVKMMRFSIDSLNGVPSIIFGLFALSFFIYYLGLNRSIFSASLIMSIVVLPLIIKNTEEAIKTIDIAQIQGSLALGASRFTTINRVIIPYCIDGIINGVILAIGKIVGETAAIMFVIGSASSIPKSFFEPGSTLATKLYLIIQEPTYSSNGIGSAYGIALILLLIVVLLNLLVKLVNHIFMKRRG
ncbi:MAG: phosphate ABC transporter permease PstA [Bacilli bacterium]|jgi:phosphate transport system permease protein|nr:phosphate ABC transporter permease PstA [Bacilli bacterium]